MILGNGPIGRSVDVASATLAHTRITASIFLNDSKHYLGGNSRGCRDREGRLVVLRREKSEEEVVGELGHWIDCCMDGWK